MDGLDGLLEKYLFHVIKCTRINSNHTKWNDQTGIIWTRQEAEAQQQMLQQNEEAALVPGCLSPSRSLSTLLMYVSIMTSLICYV